MIRLAVPKLGQVFPDMKVKAIGLDFIRCEAQIIGAYFAEDGTEGEGFTKMLSDEDFLEFYDQWSTHADIYTPFLSEGDTVDVTGELDGALTIVNGQEVITLAREKIIEAPEPVAEPIIEPVVAPMITV